MKTQCQVNMQGHLAADPELGETTDGQPYCQMALACERIEKDKRGDAEVDYHRIIVDGDLARQCAEYLQKGKEVCLSGRLENRSYNDKDGNKKYLTEIIANHVSLPLPEPTN